MTVEVTQVAADWFLRTMILWQKAAIGHRLMCVVHLIVALTNELFYSESLLAYASLVPRPVRGNEANLMLLCTFQMALLQKSFRPHHLQVFLPADYQGLGMNRKHRK